MSNTDNNTPNHINDTVIPISLETEIQKSFISYAMAVIINRALPDVRDGLKPVHRRIIYDMHELGMTYDKPFRKSARIVGDVLGKYHPHGDTAVYDAMVRLAQPFSTRYLLVEGQGNFGSVDGDGAAAMRYTEARMSKLCSHLIGEIDKDTVDFMPNFDETLLQPTVLPSRYPNLLANGSSGIAVGMATNIPPHNLGEIIDATIHLMENPEAGVDDLMEFIKGPDFPTGGLILGNSGVRDAYHTGRGRIIVRAKTEIEPMSQNRNRIVVKEIPYMVNKAKLIQNIADHIKDKRLEGISAIRDESDRNGMRIVIELKRDVSPQVVLNYLYKRTQMQDTFGAIMLALVDGEPKLLNLRDMIFHYVEHQKDVVTRRTKFDLDKAEARSHILEGLIKALDFIDEIVELIKASPDVNTARDALMERYSFSQKQAQAILDMRLARLTGLEREKLQAEFNELQQKIAYLLSILASEEKLISIIKEEILLIKEAFNDERRTGFSYDDSDIDIGDLIQEEDVVLTLTHFGYVKRLPLSTYRTQNRGGKGITALTQREEDYAEQIMVLSTHDDVLFFSNKGRVYTLSCYRIPESGRTAKGMAIINLLPLDGDEKVTAMISVNEEKRDKYLMLVTKQGSIKRTLVSEFSNLRRSGLISITLREDDELVSVEITDGKSDVLIGTRMGKAIRFNESQVRPSGRTSMGMRAIRLEENDYIISSTIVDEEKQVLNITTKGFGKRTNVDEYRSQSRGGKGVRGILLTEKTGELAAQMMVAEGEDIILLSDSGILIRTNVDNIRVCGRSTMGVTIMKLENGSEVVAVALAEKEEAEVKKATEKAAAKPHVKKQEEEVEIPEENTDDEMDTNDDYYN
ncbi:MAG: DNA gyrase subunit A [Christensenellaceae bacterium]|nr:DNA gyrase subunit A [Christensenellaceae bacterium]